MQGAPLAQDLAKGAGVGDLVRRHTGQLIARDVPDAVATRLNAVHVDTGQEVHHVGCVTQGDPVVLHVLTGGEVGIALGETRGFHGLGVMLDQALRVNLVLRVLGRLE